MPAFKTYWERCQDLGIGMPPLIYRKAGVYALVCDTTGKMYIGCSKNIMTRLKSHVDRLKKGKHSNKHLQNSWNKHGRENFHASVIQYTDGNIYEEEKRWIADFNSQQEGFNLTSGGDGAINLSVEVREKAQEKRTASLRRDENRKKTGEWSKQFHVDNADKMRGVLSENAKSGWSKLSKEERTARALKVWETRRANAS